MLKSLVSSLLCLAATGCSFFDGDLVTACEEAIQKRLRSPASYERVTISHYTRRITERAEYEPLLAFYKYPELRARAIRDFDDGEVRPTEFRLDITYDATNAIGVPIRSVSECKYLNLSSDDDSGAAYFSVIVDEKSDSQWAIDAFYKAATR